jgi:long-chain acyl-CoA synthetase
MSSDERNNNVINHVASSMWSGSMDMTTVVAASAALLGGAIYYYMQNAKQTEQTTMPKLIDFKNQTREVDGTHGGRVSTINKSNELMKYYYEDAKTLYDLFRRAVKRTPNGPYLGEREKQDGPFKWITYSKANEIVEQVGSALVELGLEPSKESFVGIFAKNRPEWVLTEQACNAYSLVTIPLYDTLGKEAISFILMQSQMKVVVCDDSQKAMYLMSSKANLEHLIVIDQISEEVKQRAAEMNIKVHSLEQLKELGKAHMRAPVPPRSDELATICYTSGTTGTPKGAMITHLNMVSIVSSMLLYLKKSPLIKEGDERYLSYLPLAHMFERISQAVIVSLCGQIGFYQGDIKKLVDDMKELKPTIFCTVPRLLNRIYSKINDGIERASPLKKTIFKWAYTNKQKEIERGIVRKNSIYDFAFKQIRQTLGGCTKFILTGSAPISPEILQFLRVVCGCYVVEGYGATETGGASGVQVPGETTVGNVGPPFSCCMYKLGDVPEMNLKVERDRRGEILVAGNNIFRGYYKDEEKTRAALDEEGWYHTGDIGMFDDNGCLKIVDRVKNIFKLQQGEYIAPEKIENIYVRSKYVAQAFVYGNSFKSNLIGVIVPEEPVIFEWAKQNNVQDTDMKSLCKSKELKEAILKDIVQLGKSSDLKGFEQVKDIHLHYELFSLENGLVTPTMKSKRNELLAYFRQEIDQLYQFIE